MSIRTIALRGALAASAVLLGILGGCRPGEEFPTGALTYVDRYSDALVAGADGVAVSPDGNHVYVAAHTARAVAWFDRNVVSGALTYTDRDQNDTRLGYATALALDSGGKNVYVAATNVDTLSGYTRDASSGALTYQYHYTGANIDGALSVAVPDDGAHVYVAASEADAVAWFDRDAGTGALAYVDRYASSTNLDTPRGIAVSPDGKHIYVTASPFSANAFGTVAWFTRDTNPASPAYGELTYEDRYTGTLIDGAYEIVVSPDGKHVYVAASDVYSLAWFTRDDNPASPTFGALTFTGKYSDATALVYAYSVAVSPEGTNVYASSISNDAVSWFIRDTVSGALTYLGMHKDSSAIDGAMSVAVSPDGSHVYAAANASNAVAWFRRD